MKLWLWYLSLCFLFSAVGCDRIYAFLHKPGGEEREILGEVIFNEFSVNVLELQKILKALGYSIGRPDGKFGAGTRDAVAAFQQEEGLEVTRFVDKATWAHLQRYVNGSFIEKGELQKKNIQLALLKAGYDPGPLDGKFGKRTIAAIKAFQKKHDLIPDGVAGLRTIKALVPYLGDPEQDARAGDQ